ncbi:MAG: hypothetical protein IJM15_00860 [Erysipelotrichaceae bacterium]|nr:hypothetical protein [Erysipelotrichaceae bacterium]
MERLKRLNLYQKAVLLVMAVMMLVSGVIYFKTINTKGILYNDTILVPTKDGNDTVYSGKIEGENISFIVTADKTVTMISGTKTYGPYTFREDPSAIPQGYELGYMATGVEVRQGEKIIFRGAALKTAEGNYWLYNEDGSIYSHASLSFVEGGMYSNETGEPSVYTIVSLMLEPKITHKGTWFAWFAGLFMCIVTAMTIFFADELFRWDISRRVKDYVDAEPSEWTLNGRYLGWTAIPFMVLYILIAGLNTY